MPITVDPGDLFVLTNSPAQHDEDKQISITAYLSEEEVIVRVELAVFDIVSGTSRPKYATDFMEHTEAELVAEEAGYVAALATVMSAIKKATITKLEAVAANSGVTFTAS